MYSVSDFRRGLPIIVDDQPYYIVEFQHFKMGRGKANVRTKLKHIKTGSIVEKVFGTSDSFKPPDLENRKMQYLYENGINVVCEAKGFTKSHQIAVDVGEFQGGKKVAHQLEAFKKGAGK